MEKLEKTKAIINSNTFQCRLEEGMEGYVDGYVRAGDDRPYAVVVSGEIIDMVPLYALIVKK